MNKRTIMATLAVAAVLGTAGSALAALPQVSGVTMTQTPFTRQVQITYDLADADAIITLSIETNGVAIPDSAVTRLSGDVCKKVTIGTGHTITWNAGADWPENLTDNAKARVTAWSTNAPPQVMVIDLREGAIANSYPVNYYVSTAALPYGGVTNSIYKDTQLVMRKISAGAFTMGEGTGTKQVTLTSDFYVGVFQVTQGQWRNVMGSARTAYFTDASSRAFRPMEQISYYDIRENPDNTEISPNWPQSNAVGPDSFMGKLRSKTGLATFDLPTEAQWEYACRAGTTTYYYDRLDTPGNTTSNAQMNVLGRYEHNGGRTQSGWPPAPSNSGASHGTAIVGSYLPNDWGLYDMHGNVWDWCLDWYADTLSGKSDPRGAVSGSSRVVRGGSWRDAASHCRSAARSSGTPPGRSNGFGFRLVSTTL